MPELAPIEICPDEVDLEGVGGVGGEPPPRYQVESAKTWIKVHARPVARMNYARDSYGLKHLAERGCDAHACLETYVSNGAFILAALELGYRAIRSGGCNAVFNMVWIDWCRRGQDIPEGM